MKTITKNKTKSEALLVHSQKLEESIIIIIREIYILPLNFNFKLV